MTVKRNPYSTQCAGHSPQCTETMFCVGFYKQKLKNHTDPEPFYDIPSFLRHLFILIVHGFPATAMPATPLP